MARWADQRQFAKGAFSLSRHEEAVLRSAIDLGYYDRPRRANLDRLSRVMARPRSTVHYALTNAERKMARYAVDFLL